MQTGLFCTTQQMDGEIPDTAQITADIAPYVSGRSSPSVTPTM
jgi:hypothetical protein